MADSASLSASDLRAAIAALLDAVERFEAPELTANEGLSLYLELERLYHIEEADECGH